MRNQYQRYWSVLLMNKAGTRHREKVFALNRRWADQVIEKYWPDDDVLEVLTPKFLK